MKNIKAMAVVAAMVGYHSGNAIAFPKLTDEQIKARLAQDGAPVEGVVLDARDQDALRVQLFDQGSNVVTVAAKDVELVADQSPAGSVDNGAKIAAPKKARAAAKAKKPVTAQGAGNPPPSL